MSRPPLLGGRGWGVVGLVWLAFGLLESVKAYVFTRVQGAPAGWSQVLIGNLPWWLFWGALTPLIFGLARRWPLFGEGALRSVAVHLPASFVFAAVHLTATAALYLQTNALPGASLSRLLIGWSNSFVFLELFTYWTVVAAWHALEHYRLYRERQEAARRLEVQRERLETEVARAKLHALQMELQPHFLFNTFNAITALVRRNENREAVEMLVRLGDLLRMTLERGGTPLVPLADEVALARSYLGIQQVRFPKLGVQVDVDDDAARVLVPTLVLQPLVENAVRHGLAGAGRGEVRIAARRSNGRLTIEVEDTGHAEGAPLRDPTDGRGVGLANTRERLAQLWGDSAAVTLDPVEGAGTRVTLELPADREEDPA